MAKSSLSGPGLTPDQQGICSATLSRVVCYLNQFFGQLGGEDKAGVGPQIMHGSCGIGAGGAAGP